MKRIIYLLLSLILIQTKVSAQFVDIIDKVEILMTDSVFGYDSEPIWLSLPSPYNDLTKYNYVWKYSYDKIDWTVVPNIIDFTGSIYGGYIRNNHPSYAIAHENSNLLPTYIKCDISSKGSITTARQTEKIKLYNYQTNPGVISITQQNYCVFPYHQQQSYQIKVENIISPSTNYNFSDFNVYFEIDLNGSIQNFPADENYELEYTLSFNQYTDILKITRFAENTYHQKKTSTITLKPVPQLNAPTIGYDKLICFDNPTPPYINVVNTSGGSNHYNKQLQVSKDSIFWDIYENENDFLTKVNPPNTYYIRTLVSDMTCPNYEVFSNTIIHNNLEELQPPLIYPNQQINFNMIPERLYFLQSPSGGSNQFIYQWQHTTEFVRNPVTNELEPVNFLNIPNANNIYYDPPALLKTTAYRVIATDLICGDVYSENLIISVYTELQPGLIGTAQTICYNTPFDTLREIEMPSGGSGQYTFQWQESVNNANWTDTQFANTINLNPIKLTSSRYYRRRVESDNIVKYSNSILITVDNQVPKPSLLGINTYCKGSQVVINIEEPNPVYTYHWEINDTIAFVGENYMIDSIAYDYYISVKSSNLLNCFSSTEHQIVSVFPTLQPPTISANQTIDYWTIPQALKIEYSAIGGGGYYSYQWQGKSGTGEWKNINNAIQTTYSPPALIETTHYRLRVTDEQCGETFSNEITITVHPDLQPGEIGSNHTVCYNTKSDTLKSLQNPQGGNGNFTYQWQKSGNGVEWENINYTNQLEYVSQPLTSSTYFRRTVTSGTLVKHSNPVLVTANNQLFAPVVNGAGIYCKDQNAGFSVSNPNPEHTYHWLIDGSIDYIGNTYYIYNIEKTTELKTKAVDALGCESPNTTSVAELDPIKADFIISKTPVDVGEKVDFISTSTNASHWNWNLGLAETYTVENPTAYYNVPGTYDISLTVSSADLCFDTKKMEGALVVLEPNGVNVPTAQAAILVYPNPTTNGLVYIDANGTAIDLYQIYNSAGVLVKQGQFLAEIEQLSLPTQGMFLIRLFSKGINTINLKIIAQ